MSALGQLETSDISRAMFVVRRIADIFSVTKKNVLFAGE